MLQKIIELSNLFSIPSPSYLPEGVWEQDGKFWVECSICGRTVEVPCDLNEIPAKGYKHYCGKDPWCCP